jgi:DNA-binding SARP family transcriptional activator
MKTERRMSAGDIGTISERSVRFFGQPSLVPPANQRLVELLRSSHDVPCFICAPGKTGRTSLALDYAQRQHHLDEVLWMDAASDGFREAIDSGMLMEHLERQWANGPACYRLVVIDDLPSLTDRVAARFSNWLDCLAEKDVEIIVISTPHEDCLGDYQSDRLLIEGGRLVASQKWGAERVVETMECFFEAPIPRELTTLATLMLLLGRGIVDNLRDLGYQISAASPPLLKRYCPLIKINEATGHFDATGLPAQRLTRHLLALLNEAPRTGEEPGMSDTERCFERLTQLSVHLFERSEREQSHLLLELAGRLLTGDEEGFSSDSSCFAAPVDPADFAECSNPLDSMEPGIADAVVVRSSAVESIMAEPVLVSAGQEALVVKLFGYLEIFKGGKRLEGKELQRRKVRTLLIHLVLNRGCGIARDTLMERIWPEKDFVRAKDNFYATWSRLNRILSQGDKGDPYLTNNRGLCRLETTLVTTDINEFEQLSRSILFEQGSVEQRIEAIYRLEQLYRGDILSGCGVDSFVQAAQLRYRAVLVDVMLEASRLFSQQGNDTNAVWFARKAYDTDPSREDVYRILMAMQDRAGQRTSALKTYFDCKRFLSEELGILPSQKTTALYQELILDRR